MNLKMELKEQPQQQEQESKSGNRASPKSKKQASPKKEAKKLDQQQTQQVKEKAVTQERHISRKQSVIKKLNEDEKVERSITPLSELPKNFDKPLKSRAEKHNSAYTSEIIKTPEKKSNLNGNSETMQTASGLKQSMMEGSIGSEDSLSDNENSYSPSPKKPLTGKQLAIIQFEQRSMPRAYKNCNLGAHSLTYCVYGGNFPQVVRDAMALRRNAAGQPIWLEVQAVTDTIMGIDFVFKPVNFQRQHGFDMMTKRALMRPERPFAYCHFENISTLTSKSGLIRRLRDYYERTTMFKESMYTYECSMAFSFITPTSEYLSDNPELSKVRKYFFRFEKSNYSDCRLPARQLTKNIWIVKPENENRGRGIEIVTSWKDLISHIMLSKGERIIIQKYIERPLLFNGRKFDIRVLGLIDADKNFYLYKPCYLRTSSDDYSLTKMNKFIHLTNNCYQMHSQNYENHEKGNQLPYSVFLEYLDQHYAKRYPDLDKGHLMQRMIDLMIDCHLSAINVLDPRRRPGFKFEIVGFDFILDEDLRVWLIEVNTCPYMGPVLTQNYPNFMLDMLDDTFKLTIDKYFLNESLSPEDLSTGLSNNQKSDAVPPEQSSNFTEYECLWSSERGINKRSSLGLKSADQEALAKATQKVLDQLPTPENGDKKQVPKKFQKYLKRCKEFWDIPASLYPSNKLHQKVIKSQFKFMQKYFKARQEELAQHQKLLKMRNAKFVHLATSPNPPSILSNSITNQRGVAPSNGIPKKLLGASNHLSVGQQQLPKYLRNKLLSHCELPNAKASTQSTKPSKDEQIKQLTQLDTSNTGDSMKAYVIDQSRRSGKWQQQIMNFPLPKPMPKPGRHLQNQQNIEGDKIPHVSKDFEMAIAMNTIKNGLHLEEFPNSKPSEKRISSAGDISGLSSTANRQKSNSNFGLSQKTMNNESQKLTTIANRNRQQRIQEANRQGAQSGIEVRRKSNENMSRKSYVRKAIAPQTDARAYQETASEQQWLKTHGELPIPKPPSSLKSGQHLDSFDIQENRVNRQERMTMNIKKQVEISNQINKSNDTNVPQQNNITNSQATKDESTKVFSRVNSKTRQSPVYNNKRNQSFSKMSQQRQEKALSNQMDQNSNLNDKEDKAMSRHDVNVMDDFLSMSPKHSLRLEGQSVSNPDRLKNKTAAIDNSKIFSDQQVVNPFKITRDSTYVKRDDVSNNTQCNPAVMSNQSMQRAEKGRVNSLANGRIHKNSAGSNIYVDFAQLQENQQLHVTPKNAKIILPLQGPSGSIPRPTNNQPQAPMFLEFQDKRLGYHKSQNNPYKQQINHIINARENYYQSKMKQMQSDYRSEAPGSNHRDVLEQHSAVISKNSGSKQECLKKKNSKLNEKTLPFFSKVIQGISPVLEQTNRKRQMQELENQLSCSTGGKKNSAMLPPSSSSSLFGSFPAALQNEARAYQHHQGNFQNMLKQTINEKHENMTPLDAIEKEKSKKNEVGDNSQSQNRRGIHNYDQQDQLLQNLHDKIGIRQQMENKQKFSGQLTSGSQKRNLSRQKEHSSNGLPPESCVMFDDINELEQEVVRQITDDRQKTMKVGNIPIPIDYHHQSHFRDKKNDTRILPPQAKYPQFSQFMPITKRMGQAKKLREGNKSLNKNILPLHSMQGLNKMSHEVSQRSLRALHIEQSRIKKNSENQKLCNELKIEQQFKYI